MDLQFKMSDDLKDLFTALAKAQAEMGEATKSSVNPHFKSKYADLAEVIQVAKAINKYGLAFSQLPLGDNGLLTILTHESGQYISGFMTMKLERDTPQGHGSRLSYQRRYCLSALLGIAQTDDDGNAASEPIKKGMPCPWGKDTEQNLKTNLLKQGFNAETLAVKVGNWPPTNQDEWERTRALARAAKP